MSFVAFISSNYNIINKIANVNTYKYHTIQNNYGTPLQASYDSY